MERRSDDGAEHFIVELDGGEEADEEKMGGRNGGKNKEAANEPREDVDARRRVHLVFPRRVIAMTGDCG